MAIYNHNQPDLGGDISPRGNFNSQSAKPQNLAPARLSPPDNPIETHETIRLRAQLAQAQRAGRKGGRKRKSQYSSRIPSMNEPSNLKQLSEVKHRLAEVETLVKLLKDVYDKRIAKLEQELHEVKMRMIS